MILLKYMKEMWLPLSTYNGIYEVSNKGDVRNSTTGLVLSLYKQKNGYLSVGLCNNGNQSTRYIHRLVAEAFLDRDDGFQQVNHINGIKTDNSVRNLEWCTAKQNHAHARRLGLIDASKLFKPVMAFNDIEERKFKSLTGASTATGCLKTNIAKCCRGHRKRAGGYEWKYLPKKAA